VRLLVTGGAGYIGSVVAAQLLTAGHEVTVLDDLTSGHEDAVPEGARFVQGHTGDAPAVRDALAGCEGVLHFAAASLVAESMQQPEKYFRNNVLGTFELLAAMRESGVRRLVFSSTAATYGEPESVPITEDAPTRPTSAYGASKLAVDHMIRFECLAHGLAGVSLRYFNVAGAFGRYGERHAVETHLIPIVLQVAAGQREAVSVFGTDYPTRDGTAVRDYIHVVDLGVAHALALAAVAPGEHRVYNLGSGTGFSVREVIETVREVTGHPVPTVDEGRRSGDPAALVASSARIHADLGWKPERDLHAMVADAWEFAQGRSVAGPS